MKVHIPRRVSWILGVGLVLLMLALMTVTVMVTIRRERLLRTVPLQQPEVVPVLQKKDLKRSVQRVLRAPSPTPVSVSPSLSPSPIASPTP